MVNGEPNDKNFIWTPDLQLYEDGNIRLYDSFKRDWCILSYDGSIQMLIKGILTIKFNMNLSKYPYDVQNITMNFDLWHYT